MGSFLSQEELKKIGFKSLGVNVSLSKMAMIHSPELITLGNNVRIDDFAFLSGNITLGNYIHISPYCELLGGSADAGIVMKDFSGCSSRVTINAMSDDYSGEFMTNPTIPSTFTNVLKQRVLIQEYAIIGATCVILPGVEIGEGTAVGAMSMVTKSLPAWKVCQGIPARVLKERSKRCKELAQQLLASDISFRTV